MRDKEEYIQDVAKLAAVIWQTCTSHPVDVAASALIEVLCTGIECFVPEEHKALTRLECIQYLLDDATTDEQFKVLS